MPDLPRPADDLVPATADEIASAFAHALPFDARGKARLAGGDLAASLAAERLVDRLQQSGFVLMRGRGARGQRRRALHRPPTRAPGSGGG